MRRSSARPSLHHEVWESLGSQDPDWAVLTDPGRRHGGWDDDRDAFYASGRADIEDILGILPADCGRDRALDWGSGTGRLSFALLENFQQVMAVDVSRSMLAALSQRADQLGFAERLTPTFVDDVRPAGDHDLAVSLLVLQHLSRSREAVTALQTMVASLAVGGYLVVEVPDRAVSVKAMVQPRFRAYRAMRLAGLSPATLHRLGLSGISMLTMPQGLVRQVLRTSGARLLASMEHSDRGHRYVRYVAQRTS
jgi:SAM-dependent methyltransferase